MPALRAHPEATSLTRAGFQHAFQTVDVEPMFATFGKDAVRARRMGRAMASLTGGEGYEVSHFVGACDLSEIDARGGTFVDVGGSHGFVCVDLARKWRNVRFVVQDLPKTVESAPRPVDADEQIAQRVEFKPHDFFGKQDVVADGESLNFFNFFFFSPSSLPPSTLLPFPKNIYLSHKGRPSGVGAAMEKPSLTDFSFRSLLFPLDHTQLLHTLRSVHPPEPHPIPQARRTDHHQRPLPPRAGSGELLGRAHNVPHGHGDADAAERAGAHRGRVQGAVPAGGPTI